jgi:invasion protein IalB
VIFRKTCRFLIPIVLLSHMVSSVAVAQSNSGGLKLGQEPAEPTLDLGTGTTGTAAEAATGDAATGKGAVESGTGAVTPPADGKAALDPGSAPIAANAAERTKYGDWEVACVEPGKNCAMAQIGNDSTGTPVLEMVIRKLAEPLEADGRTAIAVLDVITPLGVVLTAGLSVKIDKSKAESAPFQICTEQGCLVREPVDKGLIDRFRRGRVAQLRVVAANQGDVTADISLSGFTKAFAALK